MKKFLTLFLIGSGITAFAQQDIQFTQFMNNRLYYNPGVAGSSGSICFNGVHRSQWVGFDNAPVTQNLTVEVPIKLLHGGVSLNVVNDQIGFYQNTSFGVGYAYQMVLGQGVLGIGASVDFNTNQVMTGEAYILPTPGSDPSIALQGSSGLAIDGSFGIYYQDGRMYAGVSSRRLIGATTDLESQTGSVTQLENVRHYFVFGGYDIPIENTNFVITPAAMIKFDESTINPQADINVTAMYNNKIWGGVSYRIDDAISLMAGYQIMPALRVAYSYDLTTSDLNVASAGSHEITASYCFKIVIPERVRGRYHNPIFL